MKLNLLSFLVFACMFTSCAFHGGQMLSSNAVLDKPNFVCVKRDLKGTASAVRIFGLGGLARQALVGDAKKKMLIESPLKDNQALVNVTVNFKSSLFFMFAQTQTCTVTADVIEFQERNGQVNR